MATPNEAPIERLKVSTPVAVPRSRCSTAFWTATGVETFSRSMGASFGVAMYGAILNNRLAFNLPKLVPASAAGKLNAQTLTASPTAIKALPGPVQHGVLLSLARSIHVVFLFGVPLMVLAFFVTFLLKETPLRETAHLTVPVDEAGVEAAESEPVGAAAVVLAEVSES